MVVVPTPFALARLDSYHRHVLPPDIVLQFVVVRDLARKCFEDSTPSSY